MQANNLEQMLAPDEPAVPTNEDLEADWLSEVVEALPEMRNRYAHGSPTVYPEVLRTFEIVRDIVDQLWPPAEPPSAFVDSEEQGSDEIADVHKPPACGRG